MLFHDFFFLTGIECRRRLLFKSATYVLITTFHTRASVAQKQDGVRVLEPKLDSEKSLVLLPYFQSPKNEFTCVTWPS